MSKFLGQVRLFLVVFVLLVVPAFSQSTDFSYQGFLNDTSASANGSFDFEFRLFDAASGGTLLGTGIRPGVTVVNGVFNVTLNFGSNAFSGSDRFLEIRVKPTATANYTTLTPRQKLGRTPYATSSANAENANNALALGGTAASQFVQTTDARLTDPRAPLPGSADYIQNNSFTPQANAGFNVSGNGLVGGGLSGGTVTAQTQFNFGATGRILAKFGVNNLYVGTLAGAANGGTQNTLVGDSAGRDNTGAQNSMFGFNAGVNTIGGSANSFFGSSSGALNSSGANNSLFGSFTNFGSNNLTNAGAFGFRALVETSNSLILGSVNGKNGATVDTSVGIGTTAPGATLDISGELPSALPNTPNLRLTNFGRFALIRARFAGGTRTAPTAVLNDNILLALTADGYNGTTFTSIGQSSIVFRATENWTTTANGTAIDFGTTPNGTLNEQIRMRIADNGFVGIGATTPARKLDVDGIIRVGALNGTVGCIEDRDGTVIAGTCASDERYKKDITPFGKVLNSFVKLTPVTYYWRSEQFKEQNFGTRQSFGLIAQDVERLFPDLVGTDEKGYKAINYSRLPLLTIQAVKELKAENDALKQQLMDQQKQFEAQQAELQKQKEAIAKLQEFVYRPRPKRRR